MSKGEDRAGDPANRPYPRRIRQGKRSRSNSLSRPTPRSKAYFVEQRRTGRVLVGPLGLVDYLEHGRRTAPATSHKRTRRYQGTRDRGTVRHRVTPEQHGRHHSRQPVPDQPPQDSQSGTSKSSRWAVEELPSSEDLDSFLWTDAPTRATPSSGKTHETAKRCDLSVLDAEAVTVVVLSVSAR